MDLKFFYFSNICPYRRITIQTDNHKSLGLIYALKNFKSSFYSANSYFHFIHSRNFHLLAPFKTRSAHTSYRIRFSTINRSHFSNSRWKSGCSNLFKLLHSYTIQIGNLWVSFRGFQVSFSFSKHLI